MVSCASLASSSLILLFSVSDTRLTGDFDNEAASGGESRSSSSSKEKSTASSGRNGFRYMSSENGEGVDTSGLRTPFAT